MSVLLKGDFHVHPLGHGPAPPSALGLLPYRGWDRDPRARIRGVPHPTEIRARVRAMLRAAVEKGLDFVVNTDHVVNTSRVALEITAEDALPLVVIPGYEAAVPSVGLGTDHVLVIGAPLTRGLAAAQTTLVGLRAVAAATGALLAPAHPKSETFYLRGALRGLWDAYEYHNCSGAIGDATQETFPRNNGLPQLANSDAHTPDALLRRACHTVVDADERSATAILAAVRAGRCRPA